MNATMARPAKPAAVAEAQLCAAGLAVRPALLVGGGIVVAVTLISLLQVMGIGAARAHRGSFSFAPVDTWPLVLVGLFFPLAVWRGDGPSSRDYHRSMPVGERFHSLTRVIAGWVWLMAALAGFILWGWMLNRLAGGAFGVERAVQITTSGGVRVRSEVVTPFPLWTWLIPFVHATVAYLLGSLVALRADRPWMVFGGIILSYGLLVSLLQAVGAQTLGNALGSIWSGRYGLRAALAFPRQGPGLALFPARQWTAGDTFTWLAAAVAWGGAAVVAVAASLRPGEPGN